MTSISSASLSPTFATPLLCASTLETSCATPAFPLKLLCFKISRALAICRHVISRSAILDSSVSLTIGWLILRLSLTIIYNSQHVGLFNSRIPIALLSHNVLSSTFITFLFSRMHTYGLVDSNTSAFRTARYWNSCTLMLSRKHDLILLRCRRAASLLVTCCLQISQKLPPRCPSAALSNFHYRVHSRTHPLKHTLSLRRFGDFKLAVLLTPLTPQRSRNFSRSRALALWSSSGQSFLCSRTFMLPHSDDFGLPLFSVFLHPQTHSLILSRFSSSDIHASTFPPYAHIPFPRSSDSASYACTRWTLCLVPSLRAVLAVIELCLAHYTTYKRTSRLAPATIVHAPGARALCTPPARTPCTRPCPHYPGCPDLSPVWRHSLWPRRHYCLHHISCPRRFDKPPRANFLFCLIYPL